ncbi:Cytochrome oxidase biogenesis protein Sco1/SenC/PrrC, putative copper metallochaperone [invertebrate metagenome]|uniref:Cytochrome oxidase biogenesis protein Sco1/SenC/PrrC, putative copper metallochaperone n=1 Tax=invertebrate metagenome TaxID=1711999 RepID=A0A484HC00_9ZZZZ
MLLFPQHLYLWESEGVKKGRILLLIFFAIMLIGIGAEVSMNALHNWPVRQSKLNRTSGEVESQIGGPFTLVDHMGQAVTHKDFHGCYILVYFGYTFCPDICPTALQNMMLAYRRLPLDWQSRIVPLFITVDPERDTVEQIRGYVAAFHPALIGLTGTLEQTTAAAKMYKAFFSKVRPKSDRPYYLVDHSSIIYLMDPQGRYHMHFSHGTSAESLLIRLKSLPWPAD